MCGMTTAIEELMKNALNARRATRTRSGSRSSVARAADWSWDRISAALGGCANGETLSPQLRGRGVDAGDCAQDTQASLATIVVV